MNKFKNYISKIRSVYKICRHRINFNMILQNNYKNNQKKKIKKQNNNKQKQKISNKNLKKKNQIA